MTGRYQQGFAGQGVEQSLGEAAAPPSGPQKNIRPVGSRAFADPRLAEKCSHNFIFPYGGFPALQWFARRVRKIC
jgi:hypothetical protein